MNNINILGNTIIRSADAPIFELPGLKVVGLFSPRRGASESCVWRITLAPGTPGTEHRLTREEIFVAVRGRALATVAGQAHELAAGDALRIPPDVDFAMANPGAEPFEAVVTFPVGGQAVVGEARFTPPWAE